MTMKAQTVNLKLKLNYNKDKGHVIIVRTTKIQKMCVTGIVKLIS